MEIKIRTGTVLRVTLASVKEKDTDTRFDQAQFDFRNENIISITNNGMVYSGNLSENKIKAVCNLKSQPTAFSLFNRNEGNYALIGVQSGSLVQIDIDAREVIGTGQGFGEPVRNISISPSSNRAITTLRRFAIIWDISSRIPVALHRLTNSVNSALLKAFFGPDGDTIITCFENGHVISWNFPSLTYQAQHKFSADSSMAVELISVSEDSQMLSLFTSGSKLILLDLVKFADPQIIDMTPPSSKLKQMEILTLWFEERLRRPIVFLTEQGDLEFFDTEIKQSITKVSAKSGFYVKVVVSNPTIKSSSKPIAAILNDGSLEIINIKISASIKIQARPQVDRRAEDAAKSVEREAPKATLAPVSVNQTADNHSERRPAVIRLYEFENLLQRFGEFPERYRVVIWKHLLELPSNQQAFATLLARGLHPAYANLGNAFPVTDPNLLNTLQRILSAVAHWCPLFAEIDYLPQQLFPFIKVLHESPLTCFEVIMTYLINWCQEWFQLYPALPYQLLAQIDEILERLSPRLLSHFKSHDVTAQMYAWPLLQSSLSDVFTREEWLQIWDHILTARQPHFLHCIVAAYSLASQNTLLLCTRQEEFQKYFQDKNPVPVKMVLERAKQIQASYETQLRKSAYKLHQFAPLTKDTYPIFANFPLTAVEKHAYQMKKIRKMETEYLQQRRAVLQLEAEFGSIQEQEEEWKRREAVLKAAEYLRKQDVIREEHRLQEQRSRLQALKQELQTKELLILEAKKRQLQRDYQLRDEANIARLRDTAHWMAVLRQTEFQETIEDAETRNIKQHIEKCRFEMDLLKENLKRNEELQNIHYEHAEANKNQEENAAPTPSGRTENLEHSPSSSSSASRHETSVNSSDKENTRMRSEHLDLEEQLLKLEENNRNMELEIQNILQQLEIDRNGLGNG